MNDADFRTLIETYGAEPERWPAALRAAALAHCERSSEARAWVAEAAALDRLLDAERSPALPLLSLESIVMQAAEQPQPRPRAAKVPRRRNVFSGWFGDLRIAGWATAVILGFVIGWTAPFDADSSADAASMIEFLSDSGFEDLPW